MGGVDHEELAGQRVRFGVAAAGRKIESGGQPDTVIRNGQCDGIIVMTHGNQDMVVAPALRLRSFRREGVFLGVDDEFIDDHTAGNRQIERHLHP